MFDDWGETVEIHREVVTDARHRESEHVFHHTEDNVLIELIDTSDRDDFREASLIRGKLHMPLGADVLPTDQVKLPNGDTVRVWGRPFVWNGFDLDDDLGGLQVNFRGTDNGV